jgi:cytochrome c-type biogenesis protein
MILLGLAMLGWLKLRPTLSFGTGVRLQAWAEARGGTVGALSFGLAFGLAFCPTHFWLFFGLMLPTAVASSTGVLFPALFALGTGVPLLLMVALLGPVGPRRELIGGMRRSNRFLSFVAGLILVLAGFYDTIVYWFI